MSASVPTFTCKCFAASAADSPLAAATIPRREPTATDVQIDILYCGICHSDIHTARNEWHGTVYPCVPGHEIIGRVVKVGGSVTKFNVGDLAGVGCLVDSNRKEDEHLCPAQVWTYGGKDKHLDKPTYGGYSESIVVDQHYVLRIPENLNLAAAAPLLCAGITTYSPLRQHKVSAGQQVGIVGLGGLGHMGVKFAKALGATVTVFTTSLSKKEDALRLGADHVVISTDKEQMKAAAGKYDFLLDTVSADHDIAALLSCLKDYGNLVLVGAPEKPLSVPAFGLLLGRKCLSGSNIGSIAETQEMLDFCGKHNIVADIELIPVQKINEAYERMIKNDIKYRFCIDMSSIKN